MLMTSTDLLLKPDLEQYRLLSEGVPYTPEIGPHGGVHYTIGYVPVKEVDFARPNRLTVATPAVTSSPPLAIPLSGSITA